MSKTTERTELGRTVQGSTAQERTQQFNSIEAALAALKRGEMVLVIDDQNRENEGDLVCAAELTTTEMVNFMATHAKGLICMPMSAEFIERLQIPQMVSVNTDNHETAFTVSIDHV
ncbi:MAG: 3,4-dihydroxy-2-butanone-4-phosphate synthase, partial [Coriobacteriales bacterium]|nr:3,4-dihydroxy-2-butanone-4-phosphate synthase [Coriobacteriales bacterium]